MPKQIVRHSYTPNDVWDQLEQRSRQTRIHFVPECPVCLAPIHHTGMTELRCLECNVPATVFQQRHLYPTADRRVICVEVKGQSIDVLKLDLQCLSCEQRIRKDESCHITCGIQTYLVLDPDDGELYIKRWVNCLNVPREPTEIPIRPLITVETISDISPDVTEQPAALPVPETDITETPNQPQAIDVPIPASHPNARKDVARQIIEYLTEHQNTATTSQLLDTCQCSREALNKALQKLIKAGTIEKVKRGVYVLINRSET